MKLLEIFSKRRKTDVEAPASTETVVEYTLTEAEQAALVQEACILGVQSLPPSTATTETAAEQKVINLFAQKAATIAAAATATIHTLVSDFRSASSLPTNSDIDYVVKSTVASVGQIRRDAESKLQRVRQSFEEAKARREYFKRTHNIVRPAKFPESIIEHVGVVVIVWLLESGVGAYFFAQAGGGLLAGLLQAVLVSIANIGVSFLVGAIGVRALYHSGRPQKAMAKVLVSVWGIFVVFFAIATAKFRDAISIAPDVARSLTLPSLLQDPLAISFDGYVLVTMAVLAGALACYKGMTIDDVIPGYGEVERSYKAAEKVYYDELDALRRPIAKATRGGLDACDALLSRAESIVRNGSTAIERIKATVQSHNEVAQPGLTRSLRLVLQRYREANRSVATGRQGDPTYFKRFPAFEDSVDCRELAELEAEQERVLARMEEVRSGITNARSQLAEISVEVGETTASGQDPTPVEVETPAKSPRRSPPLVKFVWPAKPRDNETDRDTEPDTITLDIPTA